MNALKTLPAALVAALGVIIAQGADTLPPWLLVLLAALAAGLGVYFMPPGPGLRTPKAPRAHRQGGQTNVLYVLLVVIAAVVLLILLARVL